MATKVTAKFTIKNSSITPEVINLASFGIRKGEEVLSHNFDKELFEKILGQYKGMKKNTPKGQKPLTFTWVPLSEKKDSFEKFVKAKLEIRISIEEEGTVFKYEMSFDQVKLSPRKTDVKQFSGGGQRADDRYDGLFVGFEAK